MSRATLAVPTAIAAAVVAACGASDDREAGAGTTLRLHARQAALQPINWSRQGARPGDAFIASSELDGGGHKEAYCVISARKRTTWCAVTVVLPRGQFTAEGVFTDAPRSSGTIAVLSGSGAFEGAQGTLATTGVTAREESLTIHLSARR